MPVDLVTVSELSALPIYNDGALASITAAADVDIVAGSSRYDFNNWSDASTAKIGRASGRVRAEKTLTADYTKQYKLTLATAQSACGTADQSSLAAGGWKE